MKQAYEVVLRNDNESISCGYMYVTYIRQYLLYKLSRHDAIPVDSCIYDIVARFFEYNEIKVSINRQKTVKQLKGEFSGCLQIHIRNTNNKKCPESCLRNIQDGKCTDEFMINNFCKVFFPDKYTNINTKQR